MQHIEGLKNTNSVIPDNFVANATGRFYTSKLLATNLISSILDALGPTIGSRDSINIIDPFGGDGRLITWLIEEWNSRKLPKVRWNIELWDVDGDNLADFERLNRELLPHTTVSVTTKIGDSFVNAKGFRGQFDLVITNPPWEILKPDTRELKVLNPDVASRYVQNMREYDQLLSSLYPLSQPLSKFAGWGTNLSRVGFEVSVELLKEGGVLGIIMPASFLADQQSTMLREDMLLKRTLSEVAYYPAEARLFDGVDTPIATLVVKNQQSTSVNPKITLYDKQIQILQSDKTTIDKNFLALNDYILPITMGVYAVEPLIKLQEHFGPLSGYENMGDRSLWIGREIDETGVNKQLTDRLDAPLFIKGRMISRFQVAHPLTARLDRDKLPKSVAFSKLVWRDVSRPSQKRRLILTIVPEGMVAGNSLGVAYFKDNSPEALRALLGVMSSLIFEFQLRCHLANGHVSLSALRKVYLPPREAYENNPDLQASVEDTLNDPLNATKVHKLEAVVAKYVFGLSKSEFSKILRVFPTLTDVERGAILGEYDNLSKKLNTPVTMLKRQQQVIPNHLSASLSELDLRMVYSVPPGGNWKNIPLDIPSKRLDQIRESFRLGQGSRSTYYGRLDPVMPSYTITTYFNRPGNGCHIHYSQNRVISQREAARLQSFPDNFIFHGSQASINTQIGNAVPPLLALQIAKTLGEPGVFVDLFSGAGGLGLGFKWAGWKPIVANDIDANFLKTYSENVHDSVLHGSITDPAIMEKLVVIAKQARRNFPNMPFWVLGGPPCQGFSTAGKRDKNDQRNQLFWSYKHFLDEVKPDGFVFENVTGLLNMDGGKVFTEVKKAFGSIMPNVEGWVLNASEYGVPQRRKRVILVGSHDVDFKIRKPQELTSVDGALGLFGSLPTVTSVRDALDDLPSILPGQDGSNLTYEHDPTSDYQSFVRGLAGPDDYISSIG